MALVIRLEKTSGRCSASLMSSYRVIIQ